MGLCLHVFGPQQDDTEEPEEIAECDLGPYDYFRLFRTTIDRLLDASRFPTLMNHSESDGEWSLEEIPALQAELREIAAAFRNLPAEAELDAIGYPTENRHGRSSLYDSFHNTSGDNLIEAVLELCRIARKHGRPITFM